jgi:hypothetical protein
LGKNSNQSLREAKTLMPPGCESDKGLLCSVVVMQFRRHPRDCCHRIRTLGWTVAYPHAAELLSECCILPSVFCLCWVFGICFLNPTMEYLPSPGTYSPREAMSIRTKPCLLHEAMSSARNHVTSSARNRSRKVRS